MVELKNNYLKEKAEPVTGLIDWAEVKITDILNDFTFHYKAFGENGLEAIIKDYKEAGAGCDKFINGNEIEQ